VNPVPDLGGSGGSVPGVVLRRRAALDLTQLHQAVAVGTERQERQRQCVHHHTRLGRRSEEQRSEECHRQEEQHVRTTTADLGPVADATMHVGLAVGLLGVGTVRPGTDLAVRSALHRTGRGGIAIGDDRQGAVLAVQRTVLAGSAAGSRAGQR